MSQKNNNIRKIAFVFAKNRAINYTLIDSLIAEFRTRNIEVNEFNFYNAQNIYDKEILSTLFQDRHNYDAVFALDLGKTIDYRLHKSLYDCPIILIAGDDPQNFEVKNSFIRRVKAYIKKNLYTYDYEQQIIGNSIVSKQYDIVFTHHKPCIPKYRSLGVKNIFWLPYWVDLNVNKLNPSIEKKYDLVTVMSPNRARLKFFRLFDKQNIKFKNLIGISGQNTSNHYQSGKLIFNRSSFNELNIRMFESLANKSVLLTNRIPEDTGLYELLEVNKDFFIYENSTALLSKIKTLLDNDDEIFRVSENGYQKVIKSHTQKNRVDYILDVIHENKKERTQPLVSINIISWNRPFLLELTLSSLFNSIKNSSLAIEVVILDQGSQQQTLEILNRFLPSIDKVIFLKENIGIAKAFEKLYEASSGEFIITLENDWWCNASNDEWLKDAVEIFKSGPHNLAFLKLRKLFDRQYGLGSLLHEPWSVKPFPDAIVEKKIFEGKKSYYQVSAPYNCYTFNPIIIRKSFRELIAPSYKDLSDNLTPLRSGEELPQKFWQSQTEWVSGTLLNGPFTHAGFPSIKDHVIYLPYFLMCNLLNHIKAIFRNNF